MEPHTCVLLVLFTFSSIVGLSSAIFCYECSSLLGQCHDGREGVEPQNLNGCEGRQCVKVVTVTQDPMKIADVELTERFCVEPAAYEEGCDGPKSEVDEETAIKTTITTCVCNTPYCNGATSTMRLQHWTEKRMFAYRVIALGIVLVKLVSWCMV